MAATNSPTALCSLITMPSIGALIVRSSNALPACGLAVPGLSSHPALLDSDFGHAEIDAGALFFQFISLISCGASARAFPACACRKPFASGRYQATFGGCLNASRFSCNLTGLTIQFSNRLTGSDCIADFTSNLSTNRSLASPHPLLSGAQYSIRRHCWDEPSDDVGGCATALGRWQLQAVCQC